MNEIERVLDSPVTSYWLKRAIGDLLRRDPVDAANDADTLAYLMGGHLQQVLSAVPDRERRPDVAEWEVCP